jgi:hypothetical protein
MQVFWDTLDLFEVSSSKSFDDSLRDRMEKLRNGMTALYTL